MDEYLGLPHEHDQSYWHFMQDTFFEHLVEMKQENINILNNMNDDPGKVPSQALSVEVLILINGHNKARALAATVEGSVNHKCTCSALQMHNTAIIACDEPACGRLTVDTYKYFLDIEKNERP